MPLTVNNISFKGSQEDNGNYVRATEIGVGAGAAVGGTKYTFGALKRFKSSKDIVTLSNETTQAIKAAANTGSKVKSLWGKMLVNAKTYKNGIINWCKSTNTAKFLKPVFESKAFAKVSGAIGGATAVFVFISGIGEMVQNCNKLANK